MWNIRKTLGNPKFVRMSLNPGSLFFYLCIKSVYVIIIFVEWNSAEVTVLSNFDALKYGR